MALHFIYGNSGSGKSSFVFDKVIRMAAENARRNFYVIVPEQFTMQTQRALVERSYQHVIMNIDVVSFERLAYRIFDELGIHNTVMEETGKCLILRRIAEEKANDLTVLKGNIRKMGYIGELKSMISELMQYDVSVEDLEHFLTGLNPESNLYYKLSDIHVMYKAFEDYLAGRYVTAEKVLEVLMDAAADSALLQDAVLVFDGFTGFTPIQMKLLHRLMHIVGEMYVTVTIDVREQPLEDKGIQDLFYMSRKMTGALTKAAREEHFPLGEPVFLDPGDHSRLEKNRALFHLEQNLFRPKSQICQEECKNALMVYSLASPREELTFAAAKICRMMREENYRYSDFAIVSGDVEEYAKYAKSVFDTYGIPCFVDMKNTILYHPCIELIRAALEIVEKNYSYESVFRYLRTGLAGFSEEETDLLENYVIAKGIRGSLGWSRRFLKPVRRHGRLNISEEEIQQELAALDQLRDRLWKQTRPLYEAFTQKGAVVREQTIALYEFLCSLSLEQQLSSKKEEFEAKGEEILASEYRQIYKIVVDLLDKMVDLLGEEVLSVRDYGDVLEAGFSAAKVGTIPPEDDCVILGDIERTRLEGVKVLFFLGVNDGVIPTSVANGGILSQYDRELLEKQKLELSPTAREQAFIQHFYLYLMMTKPSDALYLTYARMNADGKAARPSYLVGTLKKLFPKMEVKEVDAKEPLPPVTQRSSLEVYLNGLLLAKKGEILPEWKALHQWFVKNEVWAPVVRGLFEAAFDTFSGESLEADVARALYGSVLTNSVTRLELFAKCAYAHFLEYGLKLSEREEYTFASMDMGSMFHEILQRYCVRLEESYDWFSITEEAQDTLLREAMEEAVLTMPNESLLESARSAYVLERIFRIMKRSIWALTEQIRRGDFKPVGYEVDFMRVDHLKVEDMVLSDEKKMRLVGRIDRMDTYETEQGIYVKVIDYKSGNTSFQLLNLYYGQQLQLVVYLNEAMEKLKKEHPDKEILPAGIFYYRLDDPMVEDTDQGEEAVMEAILERLRLNGLVSLEPEAYMHMDIGLNGKSSVIPLTLKKDGTVSSRGTSGAGREDFAHLTSFVNERIRHAAGQILAGDINVMPFELDGRTGCDYCPYRSVCGFDLKIPGYGYDRKEKLKEEDIWNQIRRENLKENSQKLTGKKNDVWNQTRKEEVQG